MLPPGVKAAAAGVLAAALVIAALAVAPFALAANGMIAVEAWTEDCGGSLDCFTYPVGVLLVAPDGSGVRRVPVSESFDPQFSADGRLLALRVEGRGIAVGPWDGRHFRYVDRADWSAYEGMDWSPRTHELVFAKDFEHPEGANTTKLIGVSADTGRRRTLGTGIDPAWSPDGRRIAFANPDASQVMVMRADGRGRRALTHFPDGTDLWVDRWSRDGRMVIFTRFTSDEDMLSGVDVTTGDIVRITVPERPDPFSLSSPDGRLRAGVDEHGVYVVRRDGSQRRRVMGSPRDWGADGYTVSDWQYVP